MTFPATVLCAAWLSWQATAAPAKKPPQGRHYLLQWDDLAPLISGAQAKLQVQGVRLQGRVLAIEPDALVLEVRKSSDRAAYPRGRAAIPRALVREIHVRKWRGNTWRVAATTIGAVIGLAFGAPLPAVAVLEGAYWGPLIAAIIAVPPTLGYLLGREADLRRMVITIEDAGRPAASPAG